MNIFFVLAILSLILALRTFVILKDIINNFIIIILEYLNYTKNKIFMRYITLWSVFILVLFQIE